MIFVVALMENDNGDPEALRGIVKGIVGGSVLGSLSFDRNNKVIKLISDVNSALGTPTGAPNFDDKVGDPQELRFSSEELNRAESGQTASKTLVFNGDGGSYTLTFDARVPVWQRFANLGGVFDGQPTSVSWGPGHLEVFIHGNDGAIWHKWWNNGWSGWESLGAISQMAKSVRFRGVLDTLRCLFVGTTMQFGTNGGIMAGLVGKV